MMPFSSRVLRKVVATLTESNTASTATLLLGFTPASASLSWRGMPSLSKVSIRAGSISVGLSSSRFGAAQYMMSWKSILGSFR